MEDRKKALYRVFWILICYCFVVNLFAAQYAAAKAVNKSPMPSAIVEDLGEGYTSWEYLHVAFIIPVRQIYQKAMNNMNAAANLTTVFEHHQDHLKIRLDVLNSTLISVDIGENGYR